LLTGLGGCGGGGSSTSAELPTVQASLKAGALDLVSPVDSQLKIAGSFTTTGDVGSVTATAKSFVCGATTVAATVAVSANQFSLSNSALPAGVSCTLTLKLAGSTALASGSLPTDERTYTFDTRAAVLKYSYDRFNVVIFADQGGTMGSIVGRTVTPLVNKTGWTNDVSKPFGADNPASPIALCALWHVSGVPFTLADGRPMSSCVTPGTVGGNFRRNFPINPLTGELMVEYTGTVPASAVLLDVSDSSRIGPPDHVAANAPYYGSYIDVAGIGTYFFTDTDSINLRLTTDGFKTNEVIHVGDHQFLATYANP
jgi:hypothetical protein